MVECANGLQAGGGLVLSYEQPRALVSQVHLIATQGYRF
jgi:hypothetical protein